MTMPTELLDFDLAAHLTDDATVAAYLSACLAEGGLPLFQRAMGEVAKARGLSDVAADAGMTRAGLYRALSETGSPTLSTIDKVVQSLGLRLAIVPLKSRSKGRAAPLHAAQQGAPRGKTKRSN
jgi:probable addiction module antidote protein